MLNSPVDTTLHVLPCPEVSELPRVRCYDNMITTFDTLDSVAAIVKRARGRFAVALRHDAASTSTTLTSSLMPSYVCSRSSTHWRLFGHKLQLQHPRSQLLQRLEMYGISAACWGCIEALGSAWCDPCQPPFLRHYTAQTKGRNNPAPGLACCRLQRTCSSGSEEPPRGTADLVLCHSQDHNEPLPSRDPTVTCLR